MKKNILVCIALSTILFSVESFSNSQYYIDDISNYNVDEFTTEASENEKMSMLFNAPILESECKITGNSSGCIAGFVCPSNQEITAVKVGCNLEFGAVSDSQMNSIPWGKMKVLVETDRDRSRSFCRIGSDTNNIKGTYSIASPIRKTAVSVSCKEHDKNGGDCHVKAQFICSDRV